MGRVGKYVFACAVVLAVALPAALPAIAAADPPAAPFEANVECLGCHDLATGSGAFTKVDFGASAVDLNNCRPCHWVRNHWDHGINKQCNTAGCHPGMPTRTVFWYSDTYTPYGYFDNSSSVYTDPATLHSIHVNGSWPQTLTVANNYCDSCHAPAACKACHGADPSHGPHATPTYPAAGYQQAVGNYTYGTYNCVTTPATCVNSSCHDRAAAKVGATKPFTPFCGDCHPSNVDTHGYDTVDHVADATSTVDPMGGTCGSCHSMDLLTEHEKSSSAPSGNGCATCHPTPRTSFGVWEQGCEQGGCHAAGSPQEKHLNAAGAHTPAAGTEVCFGCHTAGTDLPSLHSLATTTTPSGTYSGCNVCHRPDADLLSNDCTVCHFTFEGHYDGGVHTSLWSLSGCDSSGCHTTRDLMGVHAEQNPAFTCQGCHDSELPEVVQAIEGGDTACGACHGGVTQTEGHRVVHWASPLLQDAGGPHYSYWTGSAGTQPTGDCAGCHVSNLVDEHLGIFDAETGNPIRMPRVDAAGAALTCATCHDSSDIGVQTAILGGFTKCEACHSVHGPIQEVHFSTYVDAPEYECGLCHDDTLTVEHNGNYTVVTPGGTSLTGCDVCHAYYEAPRGAVVQGAISDANDTRCSACHAAYHGSAGDSHSADTSASVDACGVCHDDDPGAAGMDVTAIHAGASAGPCAVCHANPARVPDITAKTAECASCHTASGTDYHRNMSVHVSPDAALCSGQCHHQNPDVTAVHPACTTCHTVFDTDNQTTACTNCHLVQGVDYHPDFAAQHTPVDDGSNDCARCHETTDLRELHVTNGCETCHTGACGDCHTPHGGMGGGYLLRGTMCAACHTTPGTDYHVAAADAHTFAAIDPSCVSAGCHASNSLPEAHEAYLARYPQYTDTCALCHLNEDPERIDWATATADCSSCHEVHGDVGAIHTPSASQSCTRCHSGSTLIDLHAASAEGGCAVCHANPSRVPDLGAVTVECASCHGASGTDYHREMDAKHVGMSPTGTCFGSDGCHPSNLLPEDHALYAGPGREFSQYEDACAMCHLNDDPARIDWAAISGGTCSQCHGIPHDRMNHHATAPESQECVACHETDWVPAVHGWVDDTDWSSCDTCHNDPVRGDLTPYGAVSECGACHALSPVDTEHYPASAHTATAQTGCNNCHYMEMKPEHAKATAGPVGCVQCHETKVDDFTVPWDKTCEACHPTKHGAQGTKHLSAATGCAGTGCHNIEDASDVHKGMPGGGCQACHTSVDGLPATTDCNVCHPGVGTNHHEQHNAASANPEGCGGCHFTYLDDEHAALGLTCATCHSSTNATVTGAIAASDRNCLTCHPDSAHNARQAYEFDPGNASMHRATADAPGMRSSFVVNGQTYTWPLPSASSFLKSGYTTDSMLTCSSCHTYTGASGPHGASMQVNIDPAYPTNWKSVYLSENSTGMSSSTTICAKCHDLNGTSGNFSNEVHDEGDHHDSGDGKCINCHVQVPHGWGRPRLIGYTTDPAPYATASGGITKMALKSYTPTGWSESNCYAGCASDHDSNVSNPWPNVMGAPAPTMGNVAGTVTDSATNAALSGAAVSITGASATTASDGSYTLSDVEAGTYTLTVTKTGYQTWSGSITVTAGQITTKDVALTATPSDANLALGKTFNASDWESSTYSPSKAGDGSTSTFWWSDNNGYYRGTEWLRVDLAQSYQIDTVEIAWYGSYYARYFKVYTSTDGSNWTKVYETSYGTSGTKTVTFNARNARYVKVECTRTGTGRNNGYGIAELRVLQ